MFGPDTRILIVDDTSTMRITMKNMLASLGFKNVVEAVNGNNAWDALNQNTPPIQLVLSDYKMPECTGVELLRKLRADARFVKLPFILVTAEGEKTTLMEAIQAGASNYILKPVEAETLKQKLEATAEKMGIKT